MSDPFIHVTAEVSENAFVGKGTFIWHHSQVREGAHIGKDCIVGKGVYIDKEVIIGNNCKIQNYACVYKGVIIKDNVFIGPHVTFTNDRYPRSWLWDSTRLTTTTVKEGASIGANATVLCGITIGEYALVGAGAVVTTNVPAHALITGNPGTVKGYVCYCGHPLTESHTCSACGKTVDIKVK
jgi:UDP-2-acetamido-3-amino-2,3-dideoxy-glucuronate N-acetyltransferase